MTEKPKQKRGFALMDPELRKAIAAFGGASVPSDKRSFSTKKGLAAAAGKKGGEAPHRVRAGGRKKV